MDLNGPTPTPTPTPTRFRPRKSLSTNRFLGVYSHAPLSNHPSSSTTTDQELNEDDIVFTPDFSSSPPSPTTTASSTTTARRHHHIKTTFPENPGILAALPETSAPHSLFYHKTVIPSTSASSSTSSSSSSSSSAASASRLIPTIPKPPQDRIPASASLGKHHQSAPVNVPVLAKTMRKHREFHEVDLDEDGDGEMMLLPPHEIVARSHTPVVACSVLEGVGRTLKGRDLRQVRNAVWRQTGFLD